MGHTRAIRILESDNNKRGDLFGRLVGDLFLALGYEDLRFNVHKAGRELDIAGAHRAEPRKVLAECKARADKVGGDEINKFIGSVDAERRSPGKHPISAYFVSLSGFTESAIAQEKDINPPRLTLFDGAQVIGELEAGRIICPEQEAIIRAGQCSQALPQLRLANSVELLAHELGWIWCFYFEHGKSITHYSLIHADGQALVWSVAQAVLRSDAKVHGPLNRLIYLPPPAPPADEKEMQDAAKKRYFEYLAADFGEIELTGLPADQEVGVRRLRLEELFVPLHLLPTHSYWSITKETYDAILSSSYFDNVTVKGSTNIATESKTDLTTKMSAEIKAELQKMWRGQFSHAHTPFDDQPLFKAKQDVLFTKWQHSPKQTYSKEVLSELLHTTKILNYERNIQLGHISQKQSVGEVLSNVSRLAILAPPGCGKSTLLKRLAIAYSFPDRRRTINDGLPERLLLPLIFRCRQLADLAEAPINEITAAIAKRAEMNGQLSTAFIALVNDALRTGAVLLLVDGLDEISDERVRLSFARQLRIFSSMYPKISMVVTSREAGFRAAAGALSSCCIPYTIAELDDIDIKNLTLAWHKEVVGDRAEVAAEAAGLAEAICNTSRVNELAKNPLLLTTLLLVKRWVGQLPTRRSVLYGKAIEVLLMTWNVEGHEPLDQEEVIPQLAYVAHTMMSEGIQRITSRRLQELLTAARQQMPEVLSFAKLSVTEFVDRVESRSSLLIQSGHDVENGTLLPVYEFRHLTFQEYLTALSMVEGYCPSSSEHDNVVAILEPHLADERWKEVIPLAAVLLGRRVHPLISWLVNRAIMSPESLGISADIHPAIVLAECVADECALAPDLLAQALEIIARRSVVCASILPRLIISKYGELFGDLVLRVYKSATTDLFSLANAVQNVSPEARRISSLRLSTRLGEIKSLLDGKGENMALGAIILAYTAYDCAIGRVEPTDDEKVLLEKLGNSATVLLFSAEIPLQFCAMWAITWLANSKLWSPLAEPAVLKRLTELWMQREATDVRHVAAWALSRLPLLSRSAQPMGVDTQTMISFVKTIKPENKTIWDRHDFTASCIVAYYLGAPWPEKLLKERFKEAYGFIPDAQPLWVGAWGAP